MTTSPMGRVVEHLRTIAGRPESALTDAQLLERFVTGRDPAAVAVLIQRHGGMVWGVCRRLLAHHHDTEDAFQATFLVLVRKAGTIRPRHMVGNWLYGVARQTALKARAAAARRRAREKQVMPMPERELSDSPDQARDLHAVLDEELSHLPHIYRSAIVACDLEGRTCREAARHIGVPDGTLAARLRRGRALLAQRLRRRGVATGGAIVAAVLAGDTASATVPSAVVVATVKTVTAVAAGQSAGAAAITANVAALSEGVIKAMLLAKLKIRLMLIVVVGIASLAAAHRLLPVPAAGSSAAVQIRPGPQALATGGQSKQPRDALEAFDMLTPAARLQWLQKHKLDKECTAVARGDVTASVVLRGSLESAKPGKVICLVRAEGNTPVAGVIHWVIDEGKRVKKGELVLELDSSAFVAALKEQQRKRDIARTAMVRAEQDGDRKVAMANKAVFEQESARVREIEQQIAACRMTAPQDGQVMYWVPEQRKDRKQQSIVAQGEPVREGQILLQVADLSRMQVRLRVPEKQVSQLRAPDPEHKYAGQPAQIRVDAFPNRVLKGHVALVDMIAEQADFFLSDEIRYRAIVGVDENTVRLLPGMSAEVTIATSAKRVLYLPVGAVVTHGRKEYCYVRGAAGVAKIAIEPGARSDRIVEVRSGLKEGEQVLSNPAVQLRGMQ